MEWGRERVRIKREQNEKWERSMVASVSAKLEKMSTVSCIKTKVLHKL